MNADNQDKKNGNIFTKSQTHSNFLWNNYLFLHGKF